MVEVLAMNGKAAPARVGKIQRISERKRCVQAQMNTGAKRRRD